MDDESTQVPRDPEILEALLMRGASPIRQAEAAERLVVRVPDLQNWLINNGFIELRHQQRPYAITRFKEALAATGEILRNGYDALEDSGLSLSCWSVLLVAANLSGEVRSTLREVKELDDEHAKLVAEAVLYSFGFFDATVDVNGGYGEDELGPNAIAYEERFAGNWPSSRSWSVTQG